SDEDMGAYFAAADAIREAFHCIVIIIHHCGIDGTRPRGHNSLTCNCEVQIEVKRDDRKNSVMTVEYVKDGVEGELFASRIKRVSLGEDNEGDEMWSCVAEHIINYLRDLPEVALLVRQALIEAIAEYDGPVSKDVWKAYAIKKNIAPEATRGKEGRAKDKAFDRNVDRLVEAHAVYETGGSYDVRM